MAGEKTKTGSRARTRVVVKRDQSGDEDVQKKPDTPPKMKEKGNSMTLPPDTGSLAGDVDETKVTSTSAERIVSGIAAVFRPIAKELIKGGIVLADNVSELASETGEKFKDLLAEAKSELETSRPQAQATDKTDGKGGS
jgi:hypothetical protein